MKFFPIILGLVIIFYIGKNKHQQPECISNSDSLKIDSSVVTLIFSGDIMQHMPQVNAAWNDSLKTYDYDSCFYQFRQIWGMADISVINLETTLAGKPYSGYPQFSAPDEIVYALKKAGIDVIATANNHSCDKGKKGIERTIAIIDSAGVMRTGTFSDSSDFRKYNPLIIDTNGIRIAILNYTYGTNGLLIPKPTIVNMIDTAAMRRDFESAKLLKADIVIPFIHWGIEYQREANNEQKEIAEFCFNLGATLIIGSHPHVVQPAQRYLRGTDTVTIAWSLGNFVSNQRQQHTDGGMSFAVEIKKNNNKCHVSKAAYILHWVSIESDSAGKKTYKALPILPAKSGKEKMDEFAKNTRELINVYPFAVQEMKYDTLTGKWLW